MESAVIHIRQDKLKAEHAAGGGVCLPIACDDCGIYGLCREVNGPDVDLSMLETIVKSRRQFKRGELLYRIGEPRRAVYAIRSGSVKTYVSTNDGRIQITGFRITGELLGLDSIIADHYSNEARVLETTMVCEVPVDALQAYGDAIPSVGQQMLKIMSQEIIGYQELMLLLGTKNTDERLATFLLNFSRRFQMCNYSPTKFNLSMSRSDIGNYLGMAEETVCRVFSRFQEAGLLTATRRQVQLHDLNRLRNIACG